MIISFDAITKYRQRHRCLTLSIEFNVHLVENRYPVLFEPIALKNTNDDTYEYQMTNYEQADTGVLEFLKYLVNFIFYRFGLEVKKTKRKRRNSMTWCFWIDLFHNNGDCRCCSVGCCCSFVFDLAWIVFNLKSTFDSTYLAGLHYIFNDCISFAIYVSCWHAAVSLFP